MKTLLYKLLRIDKDPYVMTLIRLEERLQKLIKESNDIIRGGDDYI